MPVRVMQGFGQLDDYFDPHTQRDLPRAVSRGAPEGKIAAGDQLQAQRAWVAVQLRALDFDDAVVASAILDQSLISLPAVLQKKAPVISKRKFERRQFAGSV